MFFMALAVLRTPALTPDVDLRRDATVQAVERVMPSVVNIRTSTLVRRNDPYEQLFRRFYGLTDDDQLKEQIVSIGSGVIIDEVGEIGYILTNLHVLERATRFQVQLWDGREYEALPTRLKTSQKDLVVIKIIRKPGDKPFKPIALAHDDDLLLGETVIAVGNPFGLGGSVTRGILSSKNRRSVAGNTKLDYPDWLQTDADINPGNSGGPLINLHGELIGINVAVYDPSNAKGTGFAIPVKQVSSTLSDFFSLEWTANLWLGARFRGAPYPLSVLEVQPGSPADRAGLRVGQEVLAVDGEPVKGLAALNQRIAAAPDHHATLTVLDDNKRQDLKVDLVTMADLSRQMILSRLGLAIQPLTQSQATNFQLDAGEGFLVSEVEKGSPAALAQIQPGMVVRAIDGVFANDLVNITNVLGNKSKGDEAQLTILVLNQYGNGRFQLMSGRVAVPVR